MKVVLARPRVTFWDSFDSKRTMQVERNDDEFRVILNVGSSNRTQASFILQPQDVRRLAGTLERMALDISAMELCERQGDSCAFASEEEA